MASNPKMKYLPGFSFHFRKELSFGYLRLEGNGKNSFGKVGRKVSPDGCLSLAKLNWDSQLDKFFSLPSQRNFPISFKPKVDIAKFIGKMQKQIWYYEKWVGRHASFPPRRSVKQIINTNYHSFFHAFPQIMYLICLDACNNYGQCRIEPSTSRLLPFSCSLVMIATFHSTSPPTH